MGLRHRLFAFALALTIYAARADSERSRGISRHVPLGPHARGRLAVRRSTRSSARALERIRGGGGPDWRALERFRGGGGPDWRKLAESVPPAMLLFSSATGAFAGAMRGSLEQQMDILGSTILGVIAGVGGGTLRDLLLGVPVYWLSPPLHVHLYTCVATALATFLLLPYAMLLGITDKHLVVLYADAAALASGAVIGAHIGHARTGDPVVTLAVGAVTALTSGILVDLICMQRPRVLSVDRSMYAAPALLGVASYTALIRSDMPQSAVVIVSFVLAVGLRALAWTYRLRLPRWTAAPSPGRSFDLFEAGAGDTTAIKPTERALAVALTTRAPDGKT